MVIGIGNPYRRDDGVGPAVVRRLEDDGLDAAALVECDGEATALIEQWQGRRLAIIVDAAHVTTPIPGRIHRLDWPPPAETPPETPPETPSASSHGLDVSLAVRLARELDRLPRRMLVFAVEVAETGYGRGLSPAVAQSVDAIASEVRALIAATSGPNEPRREAGRP